MGLYVEPVVWWRKTRIWLSDLRHWFVLVWKLWKLRCSPVWGAARSGVESVIDYQELQTAAKTEPQVSYCPSCGQIPDGDRRMDHARRIAHEILPKQPPRHELDAAISLYYFLRKTR